MSGDKLKKHRTGFTQIPNALICDNTITAKAKAIYCYLFSRPDDWTFYVTNIASNFKEGRDAIYAALSELEDSGWIKKSQVREGGKFSHNVFEIFVEKQVVNEKPEPEKTENDEPESEESDDGNTANGKAVNGETDTNNTDNNNTDLTNTDLKNPPLPPKGGAVDYAALSVSIDGAFPLNFEAYSEWVEYKRKDKRQKVGETTAKKQIKFLSKYPEKVQRQIIDQSIQNGWQGLFEPKGGVSTATGNDQLDGMVRDGQISSHGAKTMAAAMEMFGGNQQ